MATQVEVGAALASLANIGGPRNEAKFQRAFAGPFRDANNADRADERDKYGNLGVRPSALRPRLTPRPFSREKSWETFAAVKPPVANLRHENAAAAKGTVNVPPLLDQKLIENKPSKDFAANVPFFPNPPAANTVIVFETASSDKTFAETAQSLERKDTDDIGKDDQTSAAARSRTKPRPVSAIFLESLKDAKTSVPDLSDETKPEKNEKPWGRKPRPLSTDLTARFENFSAQRTPRRSESHETPGPGSVDRSADRAEVENKSSKIVRKTAEVPEAAAYVSTATDAGPLPEKEMKVMNIQQRIKELTGENAELKGGHFRRSFRTRPLSSDLTKMFSVSPPDGMRKPAGESQDAAEKERTIETANPRTPQPAAKTPFTDERPAKDGRSAKERQSASAARGDGPASAAKSPENASVKTVIATVFEHKVERHTVAANRVSECDKTPPKRAEDSLIYQRIEPRYEILQTIGERVQSEAIATAADKAVTLRSRKSLTKERRRTDGGADAVSDRSPDVRAWKDTGESPVKATAAVARDPKASPHERVTEANEIEFKASKASAETDKDQREATLARKAEEGSGKTKRFPDAHEAGTSVERFATGDRRNPPNLRKVRSSNTKDSIQLRDGFAVKRSAKPVTDGGPKNDERSPSDAKATYFALTYQIPDGNKNASGEPRKTSYGPPLSGEKNEVKNETRNQDEERRLRTLRHYGGKVAQTRSKDKMADVYRSRILDLDALMAEYKEDSKRTSLVPEESNTFSREETTQTCHSGDKTPPGYGEGRSDISPRTADEEEISNITSFEQDGEPGRKMADETARRDGSARKKTYIVDEEEEDAADLAQRLQTANRTNHGAEIGVRVGTGDEAIVFADAAPDLRRSYSEKLRRSKARSRGIPFGQKGEDCGVFVSGGKKADVEEPLTKNSPYSLMIQRRSRSFYRERKTDHWSTDQLTQCFRRPAEGAKDTATLARDCDNQYGTWQDQTRNAESDRVAGDADAGSSEFAAPSETSPDFSFLDRTPVLDSSALKTRVQLSKRRRQRRSAISNSLRRSGGGGAKDASGEKTPDAEEGLRTAERSLAPQTQRLPVFPGIDPTDFKAQLRKRHEPDVSGVSAQSSKSPKTPFRAIEKKEERSKEEASPKWLKDLKSKKRQSHNEERV